MIALMFAVLDLGLPPAERRAPFVLPVPSIPIPDRPLHLLA